MSRTAFLVLALSLALPAGAQIYQWKDETGKTVISDKPPVGHVRQQRQVSAGTQTTKAAATSSPADRELEFRKRQKDAQESSEKARKAETESAEKRESCDNARRQLQMLESGERIAMRDDKGERYFLEDQQREQETAKARSFIDAHCK